MPYTYEYPRPALTVDALILRPEGNSYSVLLIQRKNWPFEGRWALPGGFVDIDETTDNAVVRELYEETGLSGVEMVQLHTFSGVNRDPRGRTVSVVYYGYADAAKSEVKGGDDADKAAWFPLHDLPPLAFDHDEVMAFAKNYLQLA